MDKDVINKDVDYRTDAKDEESWSQAKCRE